MLNPALNHGIWSLVSRKSIPLGYDEQSLLTRAGLILKQQVQNDILLCSGCHEGFDLLQCYFDRIDEKYILKMSKSGAMRSLAGFVKLQRPYFKGHNDWQVVNANGDFELYFAEADKTKFRKVKVLKSHQAACKIGGWLAEQTPTY
jgi:hypothetical protein